MKPARTLIFLFMGIAVSVAYPGPAAIERASYTCELRVSSVRLWLIHIVEALGKKM